ncbi:MAG: helix-hairpin-helix domain-containing protein [Gemmatimonadota bacterium]|nr:helix-hairpin-helix domain-containing protein [Gemmatimonadota bacterium]MDH4348028.1 helix-hairpin-helix domain-containing protein [Gemmatimonadota bacterium]MDH5283710.1 helix-hairpin-helix domain-containing protein [Gemmatimonadota bacterium]
MPPHPNLDIANRLDEVAALLEEQGASPFRVNAYRGGASTVRHLDRPVRELLAEKGTAGLEALPGIGEGLASAIETMVQTGRLPLLERLRGESDPVALLESVPGVGAVLAERLHHELGIETLHDLETAAHDGRLDQVPGFGPRRIAGIRDALAGRLARIRSPVSPGLPPTVAELLDVDAEYRRRSAAEELPRIAPRRFNPTGAAWLPILHSARGPRHYTALFSNTARAHRLARTDDWVVIYHDGWGSEGQCTVVTAREGALRGRRVVRGRERECEEHYGVGWERDEEAS